MTAIIDVQHISYALKAHFWSSARHILKDVSFKVEPGEVFGFLGPNGAGKTTTIKVLLGLLTAQRGTVQVLGNDVTRAAARRGLGYLPERSYFPVRFTAFEMVLQHAMLSGLSWRDARSRAHAVLERVGLGAAQNDKLATYSKGMLQRAGLAQAIVGEPRVVILDEPMSGLDPLGRRDMRELMLQLRTQGTTVFFSTHILPDVELICDRVAILVKGEVRRMGALHTLVKDGEGGVEVSADGVDADALRSAMPSIRGAKTYTGGASFEVANIAHANALLDVLRQRGATVRGVQTLRGSLEDLFVHEAQS